MIQSLSGDFLSAWGWVKAHGSSYWNDPIGTLGDDVTALIDRADSLLVPRFNPKATEKHLTDSEARVWEVAKNTLLFSVAVWSWHEDPNPFILNSLIGITLSPLIRAIADRVQMLFLKASLPWKVLLILISTSGSGHLLLLSLLLGSYAAWRIYPGNDSDPHFFTTMAGHPRQHLLARMFQNLWDSSTVQLANPPSWWWKSSVEFDGRYSTLNTKLLTDGTRSSDDRLLVMTPEKPLPDSSLTNGAPAGHGQSIQNSEMEKSAPLAF